MQHPHRFAIILAATAVPALSSAGVSTCWIKKVALVDGTIRISFASEKPLEISGSPVTVGTATNEPFAATYELRRGQTLQVRQTPTSAERCELE
ncbi:MAG: hypothetical protein O9341_07400, partial [Paucibacter sp.]|nr:hypothetical protein [Roseateles sp.]